MCSSQESRHGQFFLLKILFKKKKQTYLGQTRENPRFSEVLTVDVHLDSFFFFPRSASRCAQVRVLILEANRIHGQCGCGPLISHLRIQRTVYLGSPRERWGLAACCAASQWNGGTNLSNNFGFREDLNFKSLSCESKKRKANLHRFI